MPDDVKPASPPRAAAGRRGASSTSSPGSRPESATAPETPAARRRYDASGRRRAAEGTRQRILDAARELFTGHGYRATSVAAIAQRAGVSPDTVYTAVGKKPALFAELVETALSGGPKAVPGREREYAVAMRAADDLAQKLGIYATAIASIQQRLAPLFVVLSEAAPGEPALGELWQRISDRRARNMRELAADLATSGQLRDDLTLDEVADVIWTMNGSEHFALLVLQRGWSVDRYRDWLHDAWCRLLMAEPR